MSAKTCSEYAGGLSELAAPIRCNPEVTAPPRAASASAISTAPKRTKAPANRGFETLERMERVRRFERPTPTLARLCSTPELHPLIVDGLG